MKTKKDDSKDKNASQDLQTGKETKKFVCHYNNCEYQTPRKYRLELHVKAVHIQDPADLKQCKEAG